MVTVTSSAETDEAYESKEVSAKGEVDSRAVEITDGEEPESSYTPDDDHAVSSLLGHKSKGS